MRNQSAVVTLSYSPDTDILIHGQIHTPTGTNFESNLVFVAAYHPIKLIVGSIFELRSRNQNFDSWTDDGHTN